MATQKRKLYGTGQHLRYVIYIVNFREFMFIVLVTSEVRVIPMRTEIIIRATRTQNGLAACYSVLRFVRESGAKGFEGVLDIKVKVKIMLDWDPKDKHGLTTPLPAGIVIIRSPKEEEEEYMRPPNIPPITNIEVAVA
nr:40S ribosomal protein S3-3 [Ipomoea batatas]